MKEGKTDTKTQFDEKNVTGGLDDCSGQKSNVYHVIALKLGLPFYAGRLGK